MEKVCSDIEEDPCIGDKEIVFLWDNLVAHFTTYMQATVEMTVLSQFHAPLINQSLGLLSISLGL